MKTPASLRLRALIVILGLAAAPLALAQPAPDGAPATPTAEDLARINEALRKTLADADPAARAVLEEFPTYQPVAPAFGGGGQGRGDGARAGAQRGRGAGAGAAAPRGRGGLARGGGGGENDPSGAIIFLSPEEMPPAARYTGPEDPAYVAWSQANPTTEPRQMEKLGRGVVAVPYEAGKVWVGWRLWGTESDAVAFNVYRRAGDGPLAKLNAAPLTGATFYVDESFNPAVANAYYVRPVLNGQEGEISADFLNLVAANSPARQYVEIPIRLPEAQPIYRASDSTAADLDGDGEYEIVIKSEQTPRDNGSAGDTGNTIIQAYKMDGTQLWTIQMGPNVREGQHYTQIMVYDLDGDGKAEVALKTADGTVDGAGKVLGDPAARWARADGKIQDGPEFFTIFEGLTGKELASAEYVPNRYPTNAWGGIGGNGGSDGGGNRNDRHLATIAYLDGVRPSAVMIRGVYGRIVMAAWDWRNGQLTQRWVFDSQGGDNPYSGHGGHSLSVGDVDQDGRDEIIYNAMIVDDNGKGYVSTGYRHGDSMHAGAFDADNPNRILVFKGTENENDTMRFGTPGVALYDAKTGRTLWSAIPGLDVDRAVAADIDPRHPGAEAWTGADGLRAMNGELIGPAPSANNFVVWWDGGLLRQFLNGTQVTKWDWENGRVVPVFSGEQGVVANSGSKNGPFLSADLFGDWREEIIWRQGDTLRVYTTVIPTEHRIFTLMHDPMYRLGVSWQNVVYNQPQHTGFYLGHGMKFPVTRPNIVLVEPKP